MEKNSYESYDFFAKDYHNKRRYHWKDLEIFLRELDDKGIHFDGYNLDLGCANGRNFDLFLQSNSKLVGVDNSIELLRLARKRLDEQNFKSKFSPKSVSIILSDVRALPLRPNAIKNVFSIATIHHIKRNIHRNEVISQLYSILKNNGFFVLTVWRRYQKKYRFYFINDRIRRFFVPKYNKTQEKLGLKEYGDKYVPWTISNKNLTYNRYYHFFSLKEIKKLLKIYLIKLIFKRGGPNRKDNYFVLTQKVVKENV
ncbi:MAG: class I SAM-dependent methyltransferase [Candidatus Lokiarchaeota archaeon]|nr:class I SAM-dependent methyltransferase [Candidatus Lokiarchaeota archaeon]